ncbi:MAG: hypothetical protein QXT45_03490 [Candidatus Bilamarchaeaceae archaeon]
MLIGERDKDCKAMALFLVMFPCIVFSGDLVYFVRHDLLLPWRTPAGALVWGKVMHHSRRSILSLRR